MEGVGRERGDGTRDAITLGVLLEPEDAAAMAAIAVRRARPGPKSAVISPEKRAGCWK